MLYAFCILLVLYTFCIRFILLLGNVVMRCGRAQALIISAVSIRESANIFNVYTIYYIYGRQQDIRVNSIHCAVVIAAAYWSLMLLLMVLWFRTYRQHTHFELTSTSYARTFVWRALAGKYLVHMYVYICT